MRVLLPLLLFSFLQFLVIRGYAGRDSIPAWKVGTRAHYGFIMPHRRGMRHLIKEHIRTAAFFFERPTIHKKKWSRGYRRPNWGIALSFTDLGNPEMLGKAASLFPYIDFPVWVRGKGVRRENEGVLFFRMGTGFGWIEKPFDRLENHKNIAIGSQGNITFSFMLHGQWTLFGRWGMSAGLGFDHYSNMAVRMPNLGINLPSARVGVFRSFGNERSPFNRHVEDLSQGVFSEHVGRSRLSLIGAGGFKAASPPDGELFPTASLMSLYGKGISRKSFLGLGLDLEWNRSLKYLISKDGSDGKELPWTHNGRIGVKAGYSLVIDELRLLGQWGVYLHNAYHKVGSFYHRFGIRYDLGPWVINGTLKTHFAKADHFELGIGYELLQNEP